MANFSSLNGVSCDNVTSVNGVTKSSVNNVNTLETCSGHDPGPSMSRLYTGFNESGASFAPVPVRSRCCLLVLANKQDVQGCMTMAQARRRRRHRPPAQHWRGRVQRRSLRSAVLASQSKVGGLSVKPRTPHQRGS